MNRWLNSTVDAYIKHFGRSKGPVVYDVGSRDGKDGEELAQRIYDGHNLWRDAVVVLFECNPPQIEVIERDYPKAILIKEAISEKEGTADFLQIHGDKNMIGSSSMDLDRVKEPWVQKTDTIQVKTRRLDSVVEDLGHVDIDIDIMKIDIEHYSYQALLSLGKYIKNVRVFHIETEIEGTARAETNVDVALFMQNNGFKLVTVENEWGPTIEDQVWVRL